MGGVPAAHKEIGDLDMLVNDLLIMCILESRSRLLYHVSYLLW